MRLRSSSPRGFGSSGTLVMEHEPADPQPDTTVVELVQPSLGPSTPEAERGAEIDDIAQLDPRILAACDDDPHFRAQLHSLMLNLESTVSSSGDEAAIFAVMGIDVPVECALISANLALVAAQHGYRVLLVDANIAVPVHDSLFHVDNHLGVSALLSSDELPRSFIQDTGVRNLSIITAGAEAENATALLDREQLVHRLMSSAGDFDLILIDCGALSPQLAARVAVGANGAVLTAKEGLSPVRQMQHLVRLLDMQQVYPSGVVLMA